MSNGYYTSGIIYYIKYLKTKFLNKKRV
ncbi:hypothetical protein [Megamonas funiformis]